VALRAELERTRLASEVEDERARTMRQVMYGDARQERLLREGHLDAVDRHARSDERRATFHTEQQRARQAWETETGMQLSRSALVGAMRSESVRPVLSGKAAAAAAAVVGWPDEALSAPPQQHRVSPPDALGSTQVTHSRNLTSPSELPPVDGGQLRRSPSAYYTPHCHRAYYQSSLPVELLAVDALSGGASHIPTHIDHTGAGVAFAEHSEDINSSSVLADSGTARSRPLDMLPIYRKTLRGAGRLQSAALPHLSARRQAAPTPFHSLEPSMLHSPYTNPFPQPRRDSAGAGAAYRQQIYLSGGTRAARAGVVPGAHVEQPNLDGAGGIEGTANLCGAAHDVPHALSVRPTENERHHHCMHSSTGPTPQMSGSVSASVLLPPVGGGGSSTRRPPSEHATPTRATPAPPPPRKVRKARGLPALEETEADSQGGFRPIPVAHKDEARLGAEKLSRSASTPAILAAKKVPRPSKAADAAAMMLLEAVAQEEGWL